MKPGYIDAISFGKILKTNTFVTAKGEYVINLIRYKKDIYFVKELNGKIVEAVNLNKSKGEPRDAE